jgi:hypothetical protein
MHIVDGKIILDEEDKEFLAHMTSLNMIKDAASTLRHIAQIWYERGYDDGQEE